MNFSQASQTIQWLLGLATTLSLWTFFVTIFGFQREGGLSFGLTLTIVLVQFVHRIWLVAAYHKQMSFVYLVSVLIGGQGLLVASWIPLDRPKRKLVHWLNTVKLVESCIQMALYIVLLTSIYRFCQNDSPYCLKDGTILFKDVLIKFFILFGFFGLQWLVVIFGFCQLGFWSIQEKIQTV
ncbi:hypothetical protein EDD86DRAFT_247973 [Gorgonomyces haynaldii]|nr:hypothetical protein EDD86DRAFT_247973 [Gorgonomyces haynaldii]